MSTSSTPGKSWDPFKTYSLSEADRNLVDRRAARKARNKAEFQKLITKPSRPNLIYDPSLHRNMAFHVRNSQELRFSPRMLAISALMFSPIVIGFFYDRHQRLERHRKIMEGELTPKERSVYYILKS